MLYKGLLTIKMISNVDRRKKNVETREFQGNVFPNTNVRSVF